MYEKLTKALRLAADKNRFGNYPTITVGVEVAYEIASALESLTAQTGALQAESADKDRRIAHVEAERDAAISDIKWCCDTCMWYQADSGSTIRRCRRVYEPSACMVCVNWEWRGAQGEA